MTLVTHVPAGGNAHRWEWMSIVAALLWNGAS